MNDTKQQTGSAARQPVACWYTIKAVTPDGDGDWTVTLSNGAWLTVRPDDVRAEPHVGDRVRVQLPMIVEHQPAGEVPND